MDLEIIIVSKVSQTERAEYHDVTYVWNLKKNDTNELTKQKYSHRCGKQTYGYQAGEGRRGIHWEIQKDIYTPLYVKQITNEDLLYSTGNTSQYSVLICIAQGTGNTSQSSVTICVGKESEKTGYVHMHNQPTLLYT